MTPRGAAGQYRPVLAACLALPLTLAASSPSAPAVDEAQLQAKALFERGRADYRAGHFQAAIGDFLDADKLKPSPALMFNIAEAYARLGEPTQAIQYYRSYLARAPEASDRREVEATIENLSAHSEPATPVVVVSAPAEAVSAKPTPPSRAHATGLALGAAGVVASAGAIFGLGQLLGFESTAGAIKAGSYGGSLKAAQDQAASASTWGTVSIVLVLVAAASGVGAGLTW
ncbi:MAG: tetratricopeptide repeat protein [Deltaproteobacteria bacterium]